MLLRLARQIVARVQRRRLDAELTEEMAWHHERLERDLQATGLSAHEAHYSAKRRFGNTTRLREESRDMWQLGSLDVLAQDVVYALRGLRQHAGFATVVLLTLAVGIGANTAIFAVIDALLMRTLPVPHSERLITIGDPSRVGSLSEGTQRTDIFSYPLYVDVRDRNNLVTGLLASGRTGRLDVVVREGATSAVEQSGLEPEHPRGRFVSGNYFSVLGVGAVVGRTFNADEDRAPSAAPVTVISYGYWQRRFAGDPGVVGRPLSVNGTPLTIVGVTASGFFGDIVGQDLDLWIPIMMQPTVMRNRDFLKDRLSSWLLLMGRLAPGVSLAQAHAGFTTIVQHALDENAPPGGLRPEAKKAREQIEVDAGGKGFSRIRSTYADSLLTLMAAVGLVLLVVCANVANLVLARANARAKEFAVRMALGAGRRRLVRQLLTESTILAVTGGALGLLFGRWGSKLLLRVASAGSAAIPLDVHQDRRVIAFTVGIALFTAILFGLVPALRGTRMELATVLRGQSRSLTGQGGGHGRFGVGRLLVVAQVALSLLLLVGTGMLVRSIRQLETVDAGVARDKLLLVTVDAQRSGFGGNRLIALSRELLDRVRAVPGVQAATFSENGIFSGTESESAVQAEGFTARVSDDSNVYEDRVGPDYVKAVGARLLRGRDIGVQDDEHAPKVAVVNATMAQFYFPGGDAIGRHLRVDSASYEIVGIIADTKDHSLRAQPVRRLYRPLVQTSNPPGELKFEIRATGDPAQIVIPVRQALRAAQPSLDIVSADPLRDLMRESINEDRLVEQVMTFFGAVALALAALGLYGVMAHSALRRTSEFGLRLALGAQPRDLTRMVLGEAMSLVVWGSVVGLPAAFVGMRLLRHQLFGVAIVDPPSIAAALIVLATSAALAGYLPAARAGRVGPLVALRAE